MLLSAQRLHALDSGTGRPRWSVAPPSGGRFETAPVAIDRTVYAADVTSCEFRIRGYDLYSGDLRWTLPLNGCLSGGHHFQITATDGSVYFAVEHIRGPEGSMVYAVGE
ncbi:hypothetical protein BJF90_35085 [Pseudonocardia sp. CNS-004]|nr:hypothetical protein BJF90_35085 [Pseudonocardia sp. CNS-004]